MSARSNGRGRGPAVSHAELRYTRFTAFRLVDLSTCSRARADADRHRDLLHCHECTLSVASKPHPYVGVANYVAMLTTLAHTSMIKEWSDRCEMYLVKKDTSWAPHCAGRQGDG
eukprot:6184027-Pleurochrysis_carterae.AAC.2